MRHVPQSALRCRSLSDHPAAGRCRESLARIAVGSCANEKRGGQAVWDAITRPSGLSWTSYGSPGLAAAPPRGSSETPEQRPCFDDDKPGHLQHAGYALIMRDFTERHREAQETLASERIAARQLLAAGVAHEIGNPLNSLTIHRQLPERRTTLSPFVSEPDLCFLTRI
jgi:hypothetical protein